MLVIVEVMLAFIDELLHVLLEVQMDFISKKDVNLHEESVLEVINATQATTNLVNIIVHRIEMQPNYTQD